GDLTGTTVTILLAAPGANEGETQKMIRLTAKFVSSRQTPDTPGYRHGMSFINTPPEGVAGLEQLLKAAAAGTESVDPGEVALAKAARAAATPAPAAPVGRLAALKAAAAQKTADDAAKAKAESKEEKEDKVSAALNRAYFYLKDLVEQLDVL